MKCVICKEGEYKEGLVTVVLTRGEYELESETLKALTVIAEAGFVRHAQGGRNPPSCTSCFYEKLLLAVSG